MPKPLRVLILEDEAADAELMVMALRRAGFEPQWERVETKADFLARLNPSLELILSDYRLPQFDGLQALELLRKQELDIPFIIVSGTIGDELAVAVMQAGAADYLMKDRLMRLGSAVTGALEAKRLRDETRLISEALIEAEKKYRSIFENVVEGIFQIMPDGRVITANPSLARILGYDSPAELLAGDGDTTRCLFADADQHAWLARLLAEQGEALSFETQIRRKDGRVIWVLQHARAIRDEQGGLLYYQGSVEDITERKRAVEILRESNRQLDEALEQLKATQKQMVEHERLHALGEMASGIAHDFNNALAPILGFSELLLHRPEKARDPATVENFLQMINTCAKDAAHVVRRLREFYRHRERGEVFLPVNINNLIMQTVALTQPRWKGQMQAKGINIDVQAELGDVAYLYCDESELREMLTNLIFNAVDALPTGGTITIRTQPAGDRVVLEISDTGTGMTDEVRQHCLEPFFSTKGERGTGLGLSMVYGVIKRHEASLDIHSELGKGTTFTIRFPVEVAPAPHSAAPAVTVTTRPLHILVVDDEQMVLDVLTDYLAGDGHRVATARGGDQALAKFARAQFDLVLTDSSMSGGNGEQLAAAVKKLQPGVPVIMLTGFGAIMDTTTDCPAGVDCLLSKPITLRELQQAVAQVCPANQKETKS